jgi:hypothetical protein
MDIIFILAVTFTFFLGCLLFIGLAHGAGSSSTRTKLSFVENKNYDVSAGTCLILTLLLWFIYLMNLITC